MKFRTLRNLIRRRVRYRITAAGSFFMLSVGFTGLGAFLSGSNLLFLMFAALLALLLVSGFLSRLVLSGLELELLLPEHVSARAAAPARIRIRNIKRLTPSFSIELAGKRDSARNTPPILRTPLYFPVIPGHATIETSVEVTFPLRGRHRENVFGLSTRFPFGFLRKTAVVPLRRETIVYPSLEPHENDETMLDRITGEAESNKRGAGLDFYRIRSYETTDSARLVDWKSTAHTGALQVREFSQEELPTVEIYFDRRASPEFERMIERCAFLLWNLHDRGAAIWFRSQRHSLALPEEGDIYDLLRYLALIEAVHTAGEIETPLDPANPHIAFTSQPAEFEQSGWQTV